MCINSAMGESLAARGESRESAYLTPFHEFVIPHEVRDLQCAAKIQIPHFVRDDKM
jgi:hypothetical protein